MMNLIDIQKSISFFSREGTLEEITDVAFF